MHRRAERGPTTTSTTDPVLSASHLVAGYLWRRRRYSVVAVRHIAAAPGQMIAVVGPNGGGKSTLLRTLAGELPPLFGNVELQGRDLRRFKRSARAQLLGSVLDDAFDASLQTVGEVIASGLHATGVREAEIDDEDMAAAWRAAHQMHLANLWTAPYERLSDGQRQRCMVARALAPEPSVLVLDEPTSHMDLPGRAILAAHLANITRRGDVTVIMSTHDLDHALANADRLWLVAGGTVFDGAPEDLLADGTLGEAFSRGNLTFDPTTATMRTEAASGPVVAIRGSGLPAQLATRVVHRLGLPTHHDDPRPSARTARPPTTWQITAHDDGWTLATGKGTQRGITYAQLADTLRSKLTKQTKRLLPERH
jgi:cobalamin transport system ATP-binding protein